MARLHATCISSMDTDVDSVKSVKPNNQVSTRLNKTFESSIPRPEILKEDRCVSSYLTSRLVSPRVVVQTGISADIRARLC